MARTNITFNDFWTAYALKRDRLRAERAWNRLPAKDRRAAYDGIAPYREQCRQSGISMIYAQGYLNNRRWEDEPTTTPTPKQEQTTDSSETEMLIF